MPTVISKCQIGTEKLLFVGTTRHIVANVNIKGFLLCYLGSSKK